MQDSTTENTTFWSGFHKKTISERLELLRITYPHLYQNQQQRSSINFEIETPLMTPFNISSVELSQQESQEKDQGKEYSTSNSNAHYPCELSIEKANNMVENCIGVLGVPLGIAPSFKINGEQVIVPLATEEPSVIAACNSGAKAISSASSDGFRTLTSSRNTITAQIQLLEITTSKLPSLRSSFERHKEAIISHCNLYCPRMLERGGGVIDAYLQITKRQTGLKLSLSGDIEKDEDVPVWASISLLVDVCESMGANCSNTIAEGSTAFIEYLLKVKAGIRIVSNLSTHRTSTASFRIPFDRMSYAGIQGHIVASRIYEAYCWANDDPVRAVTHNKGIMNGIDALALSTGQDYRAIEASAHAYASHPVSDRPHYGSLSKYVLEEDSLYGELTLPLTVGVVGGSIRSNPAYRANLGILGFPSSSQLAQIMVCVGLAQNFAALRALVTTGIQKGHMSLHARNIAIAAGTPTRYVSDVASHLVSTQSITLDAAKDYLNQLKMRKKQEDATNADIR